MSCRDENQNAVDESWICIKNFFLIIFFFLMREIMKMSMVKQILNVTPVNDAHRLIITCDSMSFAFISGIDRSLCGVNDANRRSVDTYDHILLPDDLFGSLFVTLDNCEF